MHTWEYVETIGHLRYQWQNSILIGLKIDTQKSLLKQTDKPQKPKLWGEIKKILKNPHYQSSTFKWQLPDYLSEFQKCVLIGLKKQRKKTLSYSDLAALVNSKSARAVGTVMRQNPLPLIIPCHRVVKKDKSLGSFSPCTALKAKLLALSQ